MKPNILKLINTLATIIFLILFIASATVLFQYTDQSKDTEIESRLIAVCCFFIFSGAGLLLELYLYNLKNLKK